ncbi:MAG: site-2 protease family protein [Sphingopyxis sp.]|nr:site-2 protease family protein [Sphingopyxis sp.]
MIRQLAYLMQSILSFIVFAGLREMHLDIWAVIALIVVLNFLVILIHELGHAWAAVRWGATLREICVMGIYYDVPKKRLSFRRLPRKAEVGGYVSYSPHPVRHSSKSAIAIALAGPGANLLLALAAGAALLLLPDPAACIVARDPMLAISGGYAGLPDEAAMRRAFAEAARQENCAWIGALLHRFAEVLAILSAGIGLSNLLPFDGSDGEAVLSHAKVLRRKRR